MTQGQGLESLIPKKGNQQDNNQPSGGNQNNPQGSFPKSQGFSEEPAPFPVQDDKDQNNFQNQPPQNNENQPHQFNKPSWQENQPMEAPIYYPPREENQYEEQIPRQEPPEEEPEPSLNEAVFQIEVDKIKPNPFQPRKECNKQELDELAQSIREVGIIQPLIVSKIEEYTEDGTRVHYQLISGERRLKAAKLVGMKTVPAVVRREEDSNTKLSLALIENLQRTDLNPIETARGFARLQEEFSLTQKEIATRVGKSRESVSNTLRLLNLPVRMQDAISEGKINGSQGRFLLSIKEPERQEEIFQRFLRGGVSTRRMKSYLRKDDAKTKSSEQSRNFWEKQIEDKLGIPASISERGNEKRLTFKLHTQEEWDKLINRLIGDEE